ncbi:MAG: nitroreductase family protein [bacterium]|jgi:5,6-dimethylbenzimidazole synthase
MSLELPAKITELMSDVVNVRRFSDMEIEPEKKDQLLESFRLGPSAANIQPWEMVVIGSADRRKLVGAATLDPFCTPGTWGGQGWVETAPFLAVICLDRKRAETRMGGDRGFLSSVGDTYAALQNMRLMANALGLRTAVVKEFDPDKLSQALHLPWTVLPVVIIAAGYSEEVIEYPPRFKIEDFVHREEWP